MSNLIRFRPHKVVSSLPSTLEPNAVYFVRTGAGFDLYCTDQTGNVAHQINNNTQWNTVSINSNYTANNRDKIFANTSSNAITVTTPSSGTFSVTDVFGNLPTTGFRINNVTISPTNSRTVMGATSFVLNVGATTAIFELVGTDWRLVN